MSKNARVGLAVASVLVLVSCVSNNRAPVVDRLPSRSLDASVSSDGYYVVKPGDTLYTIAMGLNLDWKELASANSLSDPNRLLVGQKLLVRGLGAGSSSGSDHGAKTPQTGTAVGGDSSDSGVVVTPVLPPSAARPAASSGGADAPKGTSGASAPAAPSDSTEKSAAPASASGLMWPHSGAIVQNYKPGINKGIDLAVKVGDPVLASQSGKVVYSGNALRGYGNLIILKHTDSLLTAYAHNKTLLVKEGDAVKKGQKIAEAGQSDSEKPVLHFEVRKQGKPVNPLDYLPAR